MRKVRFLVFVLALMLSLGGMGFRNEVRGAIGFDGLPAELVPYPVELAHWDEIRTLITLREPFRVLDIGTGIYYYVLSMSNGNHADVEPITAGDTARLMESFGGVATWSGRPVWVTVGNRTFSAAIHSVGHAQETVAGNGMTGHVCLHFYGSTTHNTRLPVYRDVILAAQRHFEVLSESGGFRGVQAMPNPTPEPTPEQLTESIPEPPPGPTPEQPTPEPIVNREPAIATPTEATVFIDGVVVDFPAFHINGHNYFRLRDLAFALNGSAVEFNLGWDGVNNGIFIVTGERYWPNGDEMSVVTGEAWLATPTQADMFLDGVRIRPRAYHIDGSNFFMLAEMAELIGFRVSWDAEARAIWVMTH